jgi:hypothetical protein
MCDEVKALAGMLTAKLFLRLKMFLKNFHHISSSSRGWSAHTNTFAGEWKADFLWEILPISLARSCFSLCTHSLSLVSLMDNEDGLLLREMGWHWRWGEPKKERKKAGRRHEADEEKSQCEFLKICRFVRDTKKFFFTTHHKLLLTPMKQKRRSMFTCLH